MKKPLNLLLDKKSISGLAGMNEAIPAVEDVFLQQGLNQTQMPPKIYLHLKNTRDFARCLLRRKNR
jgi:ornithine cyclodeaminase/alanine dehydrogenase-like protein (mu-crystallin family)